MTKISNNQIIEFLSKNSRISFVELSKILNVSETAVRKKVKQLKGNGTIKKFTIEIFPAKLWYELAASLDWIQSLRNTFLQ
ncbi:MAG: HTH domain-containing protein [Promethearchaeota archaeon]